MKNTTSPIRGLLFSSLALAAITLSFSFRSVTAGGNCDPEALLENCASDLDDFVFIKSFEVSTKKGSDKFEYSYVLSRDITYRIVICEQSSQNRSMVVNLFDRSHKLISSNTLKGQKKLFPAITYQCGATGVYYLEASFEGQDGGCGLNIIGFKK